MLLEPFFIESSGGRIFSLLRAPAGARDCVVFVPPFGEEMNKCRRQITATAQALVAKNYAVLVIDLFGTGDSDGEFADATWDKWKADIIAAISWIEASDFSLHALVATRLGCSLAADSLLDAGRIVHSSVFWQPVESGRQFMTQFLRLRVATAMMESGNKETVDRLKAHLAGGQTLEVAGYSISPDLWRSVEMVELSAALDPRLGRLAIFEVGRTHDGALSVAGRRLLAAATNQGVETSSCRIPGDPFWSSTEIVVSSELAGRTAEFVTDGKV